MNCKNCGYTNNAGSEFCAMCGAQLTEDKLPPVHRSPSSDSYSFNDQDYNQDFNSQPDYTQQSYNQQPYTQQPYAQQPYAQQPYVQQPYYTQPVQPDNPGQGLGIASLVLGIISWLCCNPMGIFSIIAIICGAVGRKKSKSVGMKNGTATAGLALGIIPLVITALLVVAYIVFAIIMISTSGMDEFLWMMEEIMEEIINVIDDIFYELGIYF